MNMLDSVSGDLRTRAKSLLPTAMIALILVGGSLFAATSILPKWQLHQMLLADKALVDQAAASAEESRQSVPDVLQARLSQMQTSLSEVAGGFLSDYQAAEIIDRLYQYAAENQVTIVELQAQPSPEIELKDIYDIRTFQLQVEGDTLDLMHFVSSIQETQIPSVLLTNLTLQEAEEGNYSILIVDLVLYTSPYASSELLAGLQPTPSPTPTVAATPTPQQPILSGFAQGPAADAHLLWEWAGPGQPAAAAATADQVAVLTASGQFSLVDAKTGNTIATHEVWSDARQGITWGDVYADEELSLVAARKLIVDPATGETDSVAQVVVYDAQGAELWSLPEISGGRYYAATLMRRQVIVGQWSEDFAGNTITAYDRESGQSLWMVEGEQQAYRYIVHDDLQVYAVIDTEDGSEVAAYDWRTGAEAWRWNGDSGETPHMLAVGGDHVYALLPDRFIALDLQTGKADWSSKLSIKWEAGIAAHDDLLYAILFPGSAIDSQSGVVALQASDGNLTWHALADLPAKQLAVGKTVLWAVTPDPAGDALQLSCLDLESGLEIARMSINSRPNTPVQIAAYGEQVYVLGDRLLAYGY